MASFQNPHRVSGIRFAPSPSGPFHIGNIRSAWVSYQLAQALKTPWIIRIEDIDRPRVKPEAWNSQYNDFKKFNMQPAHFYFQSSKQKRHWELFAKAYKENKIYACQCSRKELSLCLSAENANQVTAFTPVYSGHCRFTPPQKQKHATITWRFKFDEDPSGKHDFTIARTDQFLTPEEIDSKIPVDGFQPGYHWACAIDDADGHYALLVRAWDLAAAATPQQAIQKWVRTTENDTSPLPRIFHTSLVLNDDRSRLEKRTHGVTLDELMKQGHTVHSIVQSFTSSFNEVDALAAIQENECSRNQAPPTGESLTVIRLCDLLSTASQTKNNKE